MRPAWSAREPGGRAVHELDAAQFRGMQGRTVMGKTIPKWRRRVLVGATLMFLALSAGRTQIRNAAPQPLGTLVDVGGYRVHLYCVGNGSPTAVITVAGYSFD